MIKKCIKCLLNKYSVSFGKQSRSKDYLMTICKKCVNKMNRKTYIKNKGSIALTRKKYFQENKEKWNCYMRTYNKTTKAKNTRKIWVLNNRDLLSKRWQVKNALSSASTIYGFNRFVWNNICEKYDNKCLSCNKKEVTLDHIIPISKGGLTDVNNVQPLCQSCNSSKGVKIIDYRLCV